MSASERNSQPEVNAQSIHTRRAHSSRCGGEPNSSRIKQWHHTLSDERAAAGRASNFPWDCLWWPRVSREGYPIVY